MISQWNILGIRTDDTSVRTFVVFGFLFACVGIDTVIKSLAKERCLTS